MKMLNVRALGAALILAFAAGVALPGSVQAAEDKGPIKFLVLAAKTGPGANYGNGMSAAAQTSVDEINAKGGVLGRKVELVVVDTGTDPAKAAVAFQDQVSKERPAAVWMGASNSETLSVAPLAMREKIMLFTASDVPSLNDPAKFKYLFSMQNPADKKFDALATNLVSAGVKTVGMLLATDATGETNLAMLPPRLEKAGIKVVALERYNATDLDMTSQLRTVEAANPDLIYIDGGGAAIAYLLQGVVKLGIQRPIVGGVGMAAAPVETLVDTSKLPPVYVFNFAIGHRGAGGRGDTPLVKAATPSFVKYSGGKMTTALFLYAFSYDGPLVWATAANKVQSLDPDKIVAEIETWGEKPPANAHFMATDNYAFSSSVRLPTPGPNDFNFGKIGTLDGSATREGAVLKLK